jgi:aminoglycoside phosphotransferase (APT) family kinase protein
MSAWYPGISYRSVELVGTGDFTWSRHLVYRLATPHGRASALILVKQLRAAHPHYLPQDCMRDSIQGMEREYHALAFIHAHLGDEHVSGITAIRPLASFGDLGALVMEYRPGKDLHSILTRAARPWARRETTEAAITLAGTAGRFLALLHRLRRDSYPRADVFPWSAFTQAVSESLVDLSETTSRTEIKERLRSMHASLASLGDRAPCTTVTYLHGDLYPDNLVLVPEGRLYTIDTTFSYVGPVEADIAKFLAGVNTLKARLLLGRVGVSVAALNRVNVAFLEGYSSEGAYSPEILKLYRLYALARRWQEASRVLQADVPRALADVIWRNRVEPELTRCLLEDESMPFVPER